MMNVVSIEVQWGRRAILDIWEGLVIFDTSDGEYGPCEFPLADLEEAIERYKKEKEQQ